MNVLILSSSFSFKGYLCSENNRVNLTILVTLVEKTRVITLVVASERVGERKFDLSGSKCWCDSNT